MTSVCIVHDYKQAWFTVICIIHESNACMIHQVLAQVNIHTHDIIGTLAAACLPVAVLFIDTPVSQHIPDNFHNHIFWSTLSASNTVDQSSPLLQQPTSTINTSSGGGRKAKVASCYIRQMSEANLLVSAEQIQLLDSVGQGQPVLS